MYIIALYQVHRILLCSRTDMATFESALLYAYIHLVVYENSIQEMDYYSYLRFDND